MEILQYKTILRSEGYANESIEPMVIVDKFDVNSELQYNSYDVQGNTAYVAFHESGFASFMLHCPKDESGFGGRKFTIRMTDGTTREIRGPWSSNSTAINIILASNGETRKVTEVIIGEGGKDYCYMSGAWDKDKLISALGEAWETIGYTKDRTI